jgi:PPM family protein phosphatase
VALDDHGEQEVPGAAVVTDRGLVHSRNEDAGAVAPGIAVVSDGVSLSPDPDVASSTAVAAALDVLGADPGAVAAAVIAAADAVAALGRPGDAPACTLVVATLRGDELRVAGVGDSRVYWMPAEGPAEQLTEDDSWAAGAVRAGEDPDRAWADARAHTLTGWLGAGTTVHPRVRTLAVPGPGLVLLCTDGLWNYLRDPAELADTVRAAAAGPLLDAARALVAYAVDAGGRDNITAALLAP